ncbi:hypothetical protein [Terrabacter sp. MAHUQ-38]|uniref:hypothetical protein n=1 Tax=unclassified Terrabacter TaxID=2630222 RepID=UPI00165E5122|nr:hypothetical protein [Terrabacter sp. MAHUQ-38]MBC9821596.1 hypothetical protein [Terrabacter sp. MAHUQ-38]
MRGTHEGTGRSRLRAPAGHRAVSALACPVIGYFVARLLVRLVPALPAGITYAVCLALALALGWRAWSARVDLGTSSLRVHNTLATTTIERRDVRRVSSSGRVEWRRGNGRPVRLPSEALRGGWWTLGTGKAAYAFNRERLESWTRLAPRHDLDSEAA